MGDTTILDEAVLVAATPANSSISPTAASPASPLLLAPTAVPPPPAAPQGKAAFEILIVTAGK